MLSIKLLQFQAIFKDNNTLETKKVNVTIINAMKSTTSKRSRNHGIKKYTNCKIKNDKGFHITLPSNQDTVNCRRISNFIQLGFPITSQWNQNFKDKFDPK